MNKKASWAVIGYGNIGRELCRQLAQPAVAGRTGLKTKPEFVLRSQDNLEKVKNLPDVVFLAIPSSDDGRTAYEYISRVLAAGKLAITAEKGALANYYAELRDKSDNFERLGINATVGGGTRLLAALQQYCADRANVQELRLVLNGTLTYIFSSLSDGQTLDKAVQDAVRAGYAEPGQSASLKVIRSEAEGDIPKKTAILFNRLGLSSKVLDWRKLKFHLSDDEISRAAKQASSRRYIVAVYSSYTPARADVIGGFDVEHDGWRLQGGFRRIKPGSLCQPLGKLRGADNGFVIALGPDRSDGVYSLAGPGAGVGPTVNAMIDDYLARR